jgi:hypothetical protein
MRLLTTIALFAATAAAQDPRSAPADPFRHAGFLPADTLFVAELRPKAEFQEELEQTRFWGALQEQLDQPGCRDLVAAIRAPLTGKEGDGLRPFDLIARGGTIAVTAPGKDGMPGVLIVVDAGELAARLTTALDDRVALGPKGGIQRRDRSGTPTWQIELGRQPVLLALAGTQLILASSTDRLDATLRCLGGTADQTLATNPRYRHFAKHLAARGRHREPAQHLARRRGPAHARPRTGARFGARDREALARPRGARRPQRLRHVGRCRARRRRGTRFRRRDGRAQRTARGVAPGVGSSSASTRRRWHRATSRRSSRSRPT